MHACFFLGRYYAQGQEGLNRDAGRAVEYSRRSLELGNAAAGLDLYPRPRRNLSERSCGRAEISRRDPASVVPAASAEYLRRGRDGAATRHRGDLSRRTCTPGRYNLLQARGEMAMDVLAKTMAITGRNALSPNNRAQVVSSLRPMMASMDFKGSPDEFLKCVAGMLAAEPDGTPEG